MTRRQWILGLAAAVAANAADPWKKKFSTWSKNDAIAIWNKSPWVQSAKVEFKIQGKDVEGPRSGGVIGPMEGPPGGNGNVGPPGGAPARAGGGIKQVGPGEMPEFRATVRWESAVPMRLAQGREPMAEPDRYVIRVSGFPILRADMEASLPAFKGTTRLERIGKEWLRPTRVQNLDGVLVFTFDGKEQPVTADDREVWFATTLGAMNLRVKFTPKDMIYERNLEL